MKGEVGVHGELEVYRMGFEVASELSHFVDYFKEVVAAGLADAMVDLTEVDDRHG